MGEGGRGVNNLLIKRQVLPLFLVCCCYLHYTRASSKNEKWKLSNSSSNKSKFGANSEYFSQSWVIAFLPSGGKTCCFKPDFS